MRRIHKVAVLGAGTMGSQIAAHVANAQIPCVLLDRTALPPSSPGEAKRASSPSHLAEAGLESALKARPAAFFVPDCARLVTTGNFDDHLERLRDCDWIVEAVTENLEVKRELLGKVQTYIPPDAIVSSNTSGISLAAIASGFSEEFRRHWLGTHFFNPPRYMKLLEIIPTPETLPDVIARLSHFGEQVLGKGIVRAKDSPNFIANRIGVYVHLVILQIMQEEGLSIEEIDALAGPAMGLPKSAMFRTVDIVGLDVMAHVVKNLYLSLPEDPERNSFHIPEFMERMIERNLLGEKTKQGFYKRVTSTRGESAEILTLDLSTFEYRPRQAANFDSIEMAKGIDDTRRRVRTLFGASDRAGRFYQKLFDRTFLYTAGRIPEISDDIVSIDRAMRWGFNWKCGIFELWDAIGVEDIAARWRREDVAMPPIVEKLLGAGKTSFYSQFSGRTSFFDLGRMDYAELPESPGVLLLPSLKAQGGEVKKNSAASLIDLGDGVLCLEFHSKMNTIGPDSIQMIHWGLKALNDNFDAMVIGNQASNFSAGANLMLLLLPIQEREWEEIHEAVRVFQGANMALKCAPKPVVAAPFGMTLGGGAEVSLHCARMVADAETYMGLVETGVGLIPAAGGVKEMTLLAADSALSADPAVIFPYLKRAFETIGMAKVSTSALEARRLGLLSTTDMISMSRDHQIAAAKQAALGLVRQGYHPRAPRTDIPVCGESAFNKIKLGLHLMRRAEFISDHDVLVGTKLATVLSGGGEFTSVQRVSEQYLLDLEREAFVSLCGEKKTVERIQYTLKTGKPLRN